MIQNYSENCDYLRTLFALPKTVSLYELVNQATRYIKTKEEEKELASEAIKLTEEAPISKEKKRGRPRKQSSN